MQIARVLLKRLEVCLWDSDMMDKIKFIILLGHKLFFFGFYYIPSILILRVEVRSKKDTSSLPLWVHQQRQRKMKRKVQTNMLWRKQRGMGQGELGGPTFRKGSGKAPLRGDVCAGPWRMRRSGSGKELEEKGWQGHLASEEGERSWAHHGSRNSLSKQLLPQSQWELVKELIGHLTLDEKEWKLQRDTQDTPPWQAVSLIQLVTVKSKGSNGTGRVPLPKGSY